VSNSDAIVQLLLIVIPVLLLTLINIRARRECA
jgi:hypothetical protein